MLYEVITLHVARELEGTGKEKPDSWDRRITSYNVCYTKLLRLETYPNYERNDQVLYQMSRAYDEIGQPDEAMKVMDRLVAEYPYSKYIDEVHFP